MNVIYDICTTTSLNFFVTWCHLLKTLPILAIYSNLYCFISCVHVRMMRVSFYHLSTKWQRQSVTFTKILEETIMAIKPFFVKNMHNLRSFFDFKDLFQHLIRNPSKIPNFLHNLLITTCIYPLYPWYYNEHVTHIHAVVQILQQWYTHAVLILGSQVNISHQTFAKSIESFTK